MLWIWVSKLRANGPKYCIFSTLFTSIVHVIECLSVSRQSFYSLRGFINAHTGSAELDIVLSERCLNDSADLTAVESETFLIVSLFNIPFLELKT